MPGQDQFVVLACDGIWDVMTNEDVVRFVTERLKVSQRCIVILSYSGLQAGYTASEICEEALDTCLKLNSKVSAPPTVRWAIPDRCRTI